MTACCRNTRTACSSSPAWGRKRFSASSSIRRSGVCGSTRERSPSANRVTKTVTAMDACRLPPRTSKTWQFVTSKANTEGSPTFRPSPLMFSRGCRIKTSSSRKPARERSVGHLGGESTVTPVPQLDGSAIVSKYKSLPEYEHPTPEFRAAIERDLDAGHLPGVNVVKLLCRRPSYLAH